jgi:hypothetical protein
VFVFFLSPPPLPPPPPPHAPIDFEKVR